MKTYIQIRCAFLYLCITVILGILLRSAHVISPFFNYQYLLHTHSHIAVLGWIYIIITTLLNYSFLEEKAQRKYCKLFIFTQITLLGMLLSFPWQGYGFFSIFFCSLFLLASYRYSYFFLKNIPSDRRKYPSYKFVQASIFFLLFSSVGIWALPVIITTLSKENPMYESSIYFFLHFQYNGFILTALTALWVQKLEKFSNNGWLTFCYYGVLMGVFGTIFLSWTGFFQARWMYWIGGISAVIWLISLLIMCCLYFKKTNKSVLLSIFVGMFLVKTIVLSLGAFPYIAKHIFFNIDLVISYLHFTFLGVIMFGILYFLKEIWTITFSFWSILIYMIAFLLTELLIFYKGMAIWLGLYLPSNYFHLLLIFSSLYLIVISWTKQIWRIKS